MSQRSRRKWVALIGAMGFNAQARVLPALLREGIEVVGFDLRGPPNPCPDSLTFVQVRDEEDLGRRLAEWQPADVIIETTDVRHVPHVGIALRAGAERVFVEKNLSDSSRKARAAVDAWHTEFPNQEI